MVFGVCGAFILYLRFKLLKYSNIFGSLFSFSPHFNFLDCFVFLCGAERHDVVSCKPRVIQYHVNLKIKTELKQIKLCFSTQKQQQQIKCENMLKGTWHMLNVCKRFVGGGNNPAICKKNTTTIRTSFPNLEEL